jgi:hypothetical protein
MSESTTSDDRLPQYNSNNVYAYLPFGQVMTQLITLDFIIRIVDGRAQDDVLANLWRCWKVWRRSAR